MLSGTLRSCKHLRAEVIVLATSKNPAGRNDQLNSLCTLIRIIGRLSAQNLSNLIVPCFHRPDSLPSCGMGSAANLNSALRTLRRMLHKGEEWNLLVKVPKFKLWPEHGRRLRLDDNAEKKLLTAANSCNWKPEMFELNRAADL